MAYIVPGDPGLNMAALHTYARQELPASMVPAAIMVVDAIPVTRRDRGAAGASGPDLRGVTLYRSPDTPRQEAL